jgi:hypothetical protein
MWLLKLNYVQIYRKRLTKYDNFSRTEGWPLSKFFETKQDQNPAIFDRVIHHRHLTLI